MSGPFKMKGSPYPDKKSRAEKKAIRKTRKKFKEETVVIDGKTYNKNEAVNYSNLTDAELEARRNKQYTVKFNLIKYGIQSTQ